MKLIKIAGSKEYMLDEGEIFNENGDKVFKNLQVRFKNIEEANKFIAEQEKKLKKKLGRIPLIGDIHNLKFEDSRKERHEERMQGWDEKNKNIVDILNKKKLI